MSSDIHRRSMIMSVCPSCIKKSKILSYCKSHLVEYGMVCLETKAYGIGSLIIHMHKHHNDRLAWIYSNIKHWYLNGEKLMHWI